MPDEIEVLRLFRDEIPGPSTDAWARARTAIAAVQAEEDATTRRRVRGRRRLFPIATLAVTAAAVAALLAVLLLPGSPGGPASRSISTAAYLTRAEHALSSADEDNLVTDARTEYSDGGYLQVLPTAMLPVNRPKDPAAVQKISSLTRLSYHGVSKVSADNSAGQLVFSQLVRTSPNSGGSSTTVFYRDGTWWRATLPPMNPDQGQPACGPAVQLGAGGWAAFIRVELKCGEFTVAGHQRVDGVNAMKITERGGGLLTLWLNPASYLPVRLIMPGQLGARTDFRWLSPSSAELGQLSLRVPDHFRQVAPPSNNTGASRR